MVLSVMLILGCAKMEQTTGTIKGSTFNPIIGSGWESKVWYEYEVSGNIYVDTAYLKENREILIKGNKVRIEYKVESPQESKIIN